MTAYKKQQDSFVVIILDLNVDAYDQFSLNDFIVNLFMVERSSST